MAFSAGTVQQGFLPRGAAIESNPFRNRHQQP
jgi:hypothetical protein